jgi:dolichyl-phosphate-mannose-protein mannosyltransferase
LDEVQDSRQSSTLLAGETSFDAAHDQRRERPRSDFLSHEWQTILACPLFLGLVLLLQWSAGAYHSELGAHPDEAAHYVTGLLFSDYFHLLPAGSPIEFARSFYAHYPKVAIGHWPPVFYIAQGLWSIGFSPSIRSFLLLQALIYALMATLLFGIVRRSQGFWIGISAGVLFFAIPVVLRSATMIMADGLLSLLTLAATLAFVRSVEGTHAARYELGFAILATLAILTKGSGVALVIVPPVVLLLLRRWNVLCRPTFWVAPVVVVALCGPWYWLCRHLHNMGWNSAEPPGRYLALAVVFYFEHTFKQVGAMGCLLGAIGLLMVLASTRDRLRTDDTGAAMVALYVGTVVVTLFIPTGVEPRFMLSAVVPCLYLIVVGASGVAERFGSSRAVLRNHPTACRIVVILATAALCFSPYQKNFAGFTAVAQSLSYNASRKYPSVLVVSDAAGEGMLVADMADLRSTTDSITLRGTKILAASGWSGDHYQLICTTPSAVIHLLDDIPVNYVVDDRSVDPDSVLPHQRLLQRAIGENPASFRLLTKYSLMRHGRLHPNSVYLYEFVHSKTPGSKLKVRITAIPGAEVELEVPYSQPIDGQASP